MWKPLFFLLVFSLLTGWTVSAAYASPYVSGGFGYTWLEDFDMEGNQHDGGEFSFDRGHTMTAAVGNVFNNDLRAEIEFGYRTNEANEVKKYNGETSGVDSDIVTLSLMANCFYDFMPRNIVSPFVGAGIGFANLDGEVPNNNAQDDVLAYQLAAGLAFSVSDVMKIDIQYRLFGTDNPEFKELDGEYLTHNLMFGLRYGF